MQLIEALTCEPDTDEKISLLSKATNIELQVLEYTINPHKTYGIGKYKSIDTHYLGEPSAYMFTLLDKILAKATPLWSLKAEVLQYSNMNGDLIKLVINKSLGCGVSIATLNKAHPGIIKVHKIQKAKEVPLSKVSFPMLLERKFDGVRITAKLSGDSKVQLYTSSGRCPMFPKLEANLAKLDSTGIVLDGELIWGDGKKTDRKVMSGQLNKALRGNPVDESQMKFMVFDCIPLNDFKHSICRINLADRLELMPSFAEAVMVHKSINYHVPSAEAAMVEYNALIDRGYEGIMLKKPRGVYSFKRTDAWVKVKEAINADILCIDVVEGTGQFTNMIGALVLKGTVEGKVVKVNVGSGLSNEDRRKDPSEFIGKMIEVNYNSVSESAAKSLASLFLPRFSCIREDL